MTKYTKDGKVHTMFQIINHSASILYDEQIAENKLLGMINACISHELRNPLNSIIAQNMEKEGLYTEIQAYIEGLSGSDAKTKMENIIVKLKEGKKIQDSSANIMCF